MRKTGKTANTNRHSQQKIQPGGRFSNDSALFAAHAANQNAEN
ncbi:hypothetical protein D557_4050 [Bordetella holmesii 70147]|nr:hypothetical protein D557_4050 [Bordetella holmesii 70147]